MMLQMPGTEAEGKCRRVWRACASLFTLNHRSEGIGAAGPEEGGQVKALFSGSSASDWGARNHARERKHDSNQNWVSMNTENGPARREVLP